MTSWRPQPFSTMARAQGRDSATIQNSIDAAQRLAEITPNAEPIFTLKHLAHLTGAPYVLLRGIVSRHEPDPYRVFKIYKRPLPGEVTRFRTIVVPNQSLMDVQRWLNVHILEHVKPHRASAAFTRGDSIKKAAERHCGARWLIKMDLRNFFESVTERQVYRVYLSIGYQPLVAFELAQLCTRVATSHARLSRYHAPWGWETIEGYRHATMGHLPQGAPTSPKLANLVARELDENLEQLARSNGFVYTRYADDLTFSTPGASSRCAVRSFIGDVSEAIAQAGFTPNQAKTQVSPPGSRKVVLGLLVDRDEPRLSREFKSQLRQHLFYLKRHGASAHASRQGGATIFGLRRHILGLIQHARQIEEQYGNSQLKSFKELHW